METKHAPPPVTAVVYALSSSGRLIAGADREEFIAQMFRSRGVVDQSRTPAEMYAALCSGGSAVSGPCVLSRSYWALLLSACNNYSTIALHYLVSAPECAALLEVLESACRAPSTFAVFVSPSLVAARKAGMLKSQVNNDEISLF